MTLNTEERYYQTLDKDPFGTLETHTREGFHKEKHYIRLKFCFIATYQKHSKAYHELHPIRVIRGPF